MHLQMEKQMHKQLHEAGVTFPDFWDEEKVIKALTSLDTYALYEYFGCSNATSFTRMMKSHFPNRPEKTSYSKYVRELVKASEDVNVNVSVSEIDPALEAQTKRMQKFNSLYTSGGMGLMRALQKLPEEEHAAFNSYHEGRTAEEAYNN